MSRNFYRDGNFYIIWEACERTVPVYFKSQDIQVYDIYYISACGEALDNDIKDNTPVDELVTMEIFPLVEDTSDFIESSTSEYYDYTNHAEEVFTTGAPF